MAFRLLFALYILSLAVMPCADGYSDTGTNTAVVVTPIAGHQDQDLCAPFCNCSCCASHIQLSYVACISCCLYKYNITSITPYVISRPASQAGSIWQPPRIS
ncbi:DUF6660 family protein [Chryseolinea sp. T2]|uniref:DUF6660 family protein n=1 Tax=Chryseolinea sp. T2 TaxID=3129255 RepID=UPI003FCCA537